VFKDDAYKYTAEGDVYHEAGFDAFATGFSFLRMLHHLHGMFDIKSSGGVYATAT